MNDVKNQFVGKDIEQILNTLDEEAADPIKEGNQGNVYLWQILRNTNKYKDLMNEKKPIIDNLEKKYTAFLDNNSNINTGDDLSDKYDNVTDLIISLQNSQMILYDAKEIAKIHEDKLKTAEENEVVDLDQTTKEYYDQKVNDLVDTKTTKLKEIRQDKWKELKTNYNNNTDIIDALNVANASQDYLNILTKDIYNISKSQLESAKGELTTSSRQSEININQYHKMRSNNQYLKYTLIFFCIVIICNGLGSVIDFIPKNIMVIVFGIIVTLYLIIMLLKTLDRSNRSSTNFLEKEFPLSDYKVKELNK